MEKVVDENVKNGAASMWKSLNPFSDGPMKMEVITDGNPFDPHHLHYPMQFQVSLLDFNGTMYNAQPRGC